MNNLIRANRLLEEIAEKDKRITPITPKDLPLFQKFFKKEPHTYGNSWTYVTQGMYGIGPDKLGYKYYDGENLSALCMYPKIEQPDVLCVYWARPMGKNIIDIIPDYAKEFLGKYFTPTYVKKIFKEQFDSLQRKGFKDTSQFPWHSMCSSEDDTNPEIIIDAKATVENSVHRETIKNALKRYRGLSEKVKVIQIHNNSQKKQGWKIAQKFFSQSLTAVTQNLSSSDDYYNPIFSSDYPEHELFLVLKNTKKYYGIFDLNRLDHTYFSQYMSLMLREELRNLNEFSIIYMCHLLLKKGGKLLNIGGSETENLHKFKSKFAIASINKMYWAVYS